MTGNCQKLGQGPLSPEAVFFLNQQWLLNFFGSPYHTAWFKTFSSKIFKQKCLRVAFGDPGKIFFGACAGNESRWWAGDQQWFPVSYASASCTESRANEQGSLHKTGQPDPEPPESSQLRGCVVRHRVSLRLRFLGLKQGSREDILYALMFGPWRCMDYCVPQKTLKVCYRWWKINH